MELAYLFDVHPNIKIDYTNFNTSVESVKSYFPTAARFKVEDGDEWCPMSVSFWVGGQQYWYG